MTENHGNKANYEELQGHISIIGAKLKNLLPDGSETRSKLEDLEDHYDRALQMRVMRNTTLEVEKEELQAEVTQLKTRQWRQIMFLFFIVFVWTVYQWPDFYEEMFENGTLVTVILSVLVTLFVSRILL